MLAVTAIYSDRFEANVKVLEASVLKHIPDAACRWKPYDQLPKSRYQIPADILAFRPRLVLDLFNEGFDRVLFCGADVEFFRTPTKLVSSTADVALCPHVIDTTGLAMDKEFMQQLAYTGNLNSDLVCWRDTEPTRRFLEWACYMHEDLCVANEKVFYDQTWLNFCSAFCSVHVERDPGYNYAYWRYEGDDTIPKRLTAVQYSGLAKADELSSHRKITPGPKMQAMLRSYLERVQ